MRQRKQLTQKLVKQDIINYIMEHVYYPKIENKRINKLMYSSNEMTSRKQKAISTILHKRLKVKTAAILTAENPQWPKDELPKDYNDKTQKEPIEYLQRGYYLYFPVKGYYNGLEHSLIIYNISLEDALYYGYYFNQESIVFIDMQTNRAAYQYWEGDDKFSPMKMQKEEYVIIDASDAEDFYTQICRNFKFKIPFEFEESTVEDIKNQMINVSNALNELDRQTSLDINEKLLSNINNGITGSKEFNNRALINSQVKRMLS